LFEKNNEYKLIILERKKRFNLNNRFLIRRVFNVLKFNIRLLKKHYLKIEYYNRNYLINIFTGNIILLFLLFLLFINDFGVYRNIYKVLKTFY